MRQPIKLNQSIQKAGYNMGEFVFKLDKGEGKEFPATFKGAEFRFWTPDAPKDENDWDAAIAALRETNVDALSAYSTIAAAYNLDRQKQIKQLLGAEGATAEGVQTTASADAFRQVKRRLRGMGGGERKASGTPRKVSEKTKNTIAIQTLDEMLADESLDAATRQVLEARKAKLAALGVATAATPAEPKADAPAADAKPKAGKGK